MSGAGGGEKQPERRTLKFGAEYGGWQDPAQASDLHPAFLFEQEGQSPLRWVGTSVSPGFQYLM